MESIINNHPFHCIGVVATEERRSELIEWAYFNSQVLNGHQLTSTGETGLILEGTLNRPITKLFTADTGGYQQMARLIESGKIDLLFFFAEPASDLEKDLDLKNLLVLASKHNVMVASNPVTLDMVMNRMVSKQAELLMPNRRGSFRHRLGLLSRLFRRPNLVAGV